MSDLSNIFEELKKSLTEAQSAQDDSIPKIRAIALGLAEIEPISDRMMFAWATRIGNESVILEHRYYDSSGPFSIQPDVNIFALKQMLGEVVEQDAEVRFPDKGIYG